MNVARTEEKHIKYVKWYKSVCHRGYAFCIGVQQLGFDKTNAKPAHVFDEVYEELRIY